MSERPDMEGPWSGDKEWLSYSLGGAVTNKFDHLVPPTPGEPDMNREDCQRAATLLERLTSHIVVTRTDDIDIPIRLSGDNHFYCTFTINPLDDPCTVYEGHLVSAIKYIAETMKDMSAIAVQPLPTPEEGICVNFQESRLPLRFLMVRSQNPEGLTVAIDLLCRQLQPEVRA